MKPRLKPRTRLALKLALTWLDHVVREAEGEASAPDLEFISVIVMRGEVALATLRRVLDRALADREPPPGAN